MISNEGAQSLDEWIIENEMEGLAEQIDDICEEAKDGSDPSEVYTDIMVAIRQWLTERDNG